MPGLVHNEHYIEARGVFGEMSFTLRGVPSPGKPGTSLLAAYSLASAVLGDGAMARSGQVTSA